MDQGGQERDPVDTPIVPQVRPQCRSPQLHALDLGNFMRTLALPDAVEWSLTSLREKLIKIGAKIGHGPTSRRWPRLSFLVTCSPHPAPYRPAQTAASPGMSDGTPFLRVAADRIGAPGSPAKCHSAPPTPPIGPQSSGSARNVIRIHRAVSSPHSWEGSIWGIPAKSGLSAPYLLPGRRGTPRWTPSECHG